MHEAPPSRDPIDGRPSLAGQALGFIRSRLAPRLGAGSSGEMRRTVGVLIGAGIVAALVTAVAALTMARRIEMRLDPLRGEASLMDSRRSVALAIARRFAEPTLDVRLSAIGAMLPEGARLIELGDRRIVVRTADPDRLRDQLATLGGRYRERGQSLAADGGMDVLLEEAR